MGFCPFLTQPYVRIITYGVFSKLDESLCSCCNSSIFPRQIPRQLLRTDTGIQTCTTFSSKVRYLPSAVLQVWVSTPITIPCGLSPQFAYHVGRTRNHKGRSPSPYDYLNYTDYLHSITTNPWSVSVVSPTI